MSGQQITAGWLDALVLTPIGPLDASPQFLEVTVRGLPGYRGMLRVEAAREIQDALAIILGPRETPELAMLVRRMFEVHDRPLEPDGMWLHVDEHDQLVDRVRMLVGAPQRKRDYP